MAARMTREALERRTREGGNLAAHLDAEDWLILRELQAQTGANVAACVRLLLRKWARENERGKVGTL